MCNGFIGLIFGHKYEARYSYGHPTLTKAGSYWEAREVVAVLEASKLKTYVCDVCTRCGCIVKMDKA